VCFVQILEKEYDKLDPRGIQYVFLGYSQTHKWIDVEIPWAESM